MARYIKKPYVIDAIRFKDGEFDKWEDWAQEGYRLRKWGYLFDHNTGKPNGFYVDTLEGTMRAGDGDYLVKGVEGEFYPCRGDIFEKTYEKVAE